MKFANSKYLLSKYHLVLENSQEIILIYNSEGIIIDCNTKAMDVLGYGDDIFQIHISDVFKNVFIYEEGHIRLNSNNSNLQKESIAYRNNQTCFPVKIVIENVSKNNKVGICSAVDLSIEKETKRQLKNLRSKLHDNNVISSELVAKSTHELRTPLNGIIGFTSNLLDTELKPNQLEAINQIKKCSNNLNSLVNDLMDFALMSDNKLVVENKEFDFLEFIRHIVNFNLGNINDKGLKFQVYISKDIPDRLIGDELRLTQVLNNLFSNAIKFTSTGQINLEVIKVYRTDSYIELLFMVIDTGIGIEPQKKDKLFRSFFQVDNSIARKYGGTGLGLSICKYIVEAMNGSITVESEKEKGSTFSFTVRLEIPKQSVQIHDNEENAFLNDFTYIYNNNIENEISEIDYVSKKLKDISIHENHIDFMKDEDIDMNELLEKLAICIEMENWERSDKLACMIKGIVQKYQFLNPKDVLHLLFAIRRENHDASLSIISEIKACMREEN